MAHGTSNSYPLPGSKDTYLLNRGFPRRGRALGPTTRFCLDRARDATITGAVGTGMRPGMFSGTCANVGNRVGDTVGVRIGAAVIFWVGTGATPSQPVVTKSLMPQTVASIHC